ncbi:hypothetical protein [Cumulibacter manganitolerans]|uniref:hypothetical protein n=1 Tax=Cumulibacter manganitolerans TaxID=1884992 RepID=UPI0012956922|nr:hypothetical protein [Cumulibacter manganitolerans]
MQPPAESLPAAADGRPAGSSTRGLIGAIAGTAAVAAIATAVIVGSSYDDPGPAAKGGAVATATSGVSLPKSAPSAPASSTGLGPSGGSGAPLPSGGPYTDEDLENLPTIPPVIEQIPALDPTIPALPSTETPQPSEEQVPPSAPDPDAEAAASTTESPASTSASPDPSTTPPVPPDERTSADPTTTASPSYPTPPGTQLTAEVGTPPNALLSVARVAFEITNSGEPGKAAAYQNPTLTIGEFTGLTAVPGTASPSICSVSVDGLPRPDSTNKDCADTPLVAPLADIAPGQTVQIVVDIALSTDVAGAVESIPLTFSTGTAPEQGGFSVAFTATPNAPFEAPSGLPVPTDAAPPTD